MKSKRHPYELYESEAIWRLVDRAIRTMVKNGDIAERTAHEYIVGHLAKTLTDSGFKQVSKLHVGVKTIQVVEVKAASNGVAGKRTATPARRLHMNQPRNLAKGVTVQ